MERRRPSALAQRFAPEVRMHREDRWLPVTVEWFLQNVSRVSIHCALTKSLLTGRTMLLAECKGGYRPSSFLPHHCNK